MDIKNKVNMICKKYDTRDPFEIADQLKISVVIEPLGSIRGYYQNRYRHKVIHINSEIDDTSKLFTCAHELGHSILHPSVNTRFLVSKTLFTVNKYEIQANKFATHMIYPDDVFLEYLELDLSIPQIAQCLSISELLVGYRIRCLK